MRRRLSAPALALVAAVLVLAIAAAALFVPYVTKDREAVSGVPVPPPFTVQASIPLRGGEEVCLDAVALDVHSEIAEFTVLSEERRGPRLQISATGPGYRASAGLDGGYGGPQTFQVPIKPPRRSLLAEFCVANEGRRAIDLLGGEEPRTASRPVASVDGRPVGPDLTLRFLEVQPGSVIDRLGSLVDRMSAFHPPVLEKPVLWLLLALLVLVLPAGAIYAVVTSFRADD